MKTSTPSGSAVPEARDFDSTRSGTPPGGVEVPSQSLPEGSPPDDVLTHAEFSIAGGSDGNVAATCTAKVKVTELPAGTVPTASVQELPALPSGVHAHPGDELSGRKAVSCGTVSSRLTSAASRVPRFAISSA